MISSISSGSIKEITPEEEMLKKQIHKSMQWVLFKFIFFQGKLLKCLTLGPTSLTTEVEALLEDHVLKSFQEKGSRLLGDQLIKFWLPGTENFAR